jgi:hypothetical protein
MYWYIERRRSFTVPVYCIRMYKKLKLRKYGTSCLCKANMSIIPRKKWSNRKIQEADLVWYPWLMQTYVILGARLAGIPGAPSTHTYIIPWSKTWGKGRKGITKLTIKFMEEKNQFWKCKESNPVPLSMRLIVLYQLSYTPNFCIFNN